jgi:putative peptide zinc metalloprotease protein
VYRLFVTFAIAIFIASRFFFVGVLLAMWSLAMMVVVPVVRMLGQIGQRPALRERRARIFAASAAVLAALVLFAVAVPLPIAPRPRA